jgi:hypothetical protein
MDLFAIKYWGEFSWIVDIESKTSNNVSGEINQSIIDTNGQRTFDGMTSVRTNRVALWRSRRMKNETEQERQIRLSKERQQKSDQRRARDASESVIDQYYRRKRNATTKSTERYVRDLGETEEQRTARLKDEASAKKSCRQMRDQLVCFKEKFR